MERLNLCKEVLENAIGVYKTCAECSEEPLTPLEAVSVQAMEELLEYRKLKDQGRLLILPCKVGDTVWQIHTLPRTNRKIIAEVEADAFFITLCVLEGRFGKTVFLTKEEAETALKKMKGEEYETD